MFTRPGQYQQQSYGMSLWIQIYHPKKLAPFGDSMEVSQDSYDSGKPSQVISFHGNSWDKKQAYI